MKVQVSNRVMVKRPIYVDIPEDITVVYGLEDCTLPICSLRVDRVAPPFSNGVCTYCAVLRVLKTEEDKNGADSYTRVKGSGQNVYRKSMCQ